jgi:hypothetical protein
MIDDLHCYTCGKKLTWSQAHIYYEDGWQLAFCSACRLTRPRADAEQQQASGDDESRAAEHDG